MKSAMFCSVLFFCQEFLFKLLCAKLVFLLFLLRSVCVCVGGIIVVVASLSLLKRIRQKKQGPVVWIAVLISILFATYYKALAIRLVFFFISK